MRSFLRPRRRGARMIRGMRLITSLVAIVCTLVLAAPASARAQSMTTGSITGVVLDTNEKPVEGASVIAIHEPSGTSYEATTGKDGRYTIPNMRVGGPYTVTVNYVGTGTAFGPRTIEKLDVNLGSATDVNVIVKPISLSENIVVVGQTDPVFSSERTGAATTITRNDMAVLPN